jgi:hypothetical protein
VGASVLDVVGWVVVVVSGTVVVVVVGDGSVLGGGAPARAESGDPSKCARTTIVANAARAADEKRRGVDIARSRRAPSIVAHRTTTYRPPTRRCLRIPDAAVRMATERAGSVPPV